MPRTRTARPALSVGAAPDHTGAPAFTLCQACGALVLARTWHHERGWQQMREAVTPALGEKHRCERRED